MVWPPQSPDLNPIEAIWAYVDVRLKKSIRTSKEHMWNNIQYVWNNIPKSILLEKKLIVMKKKLKTAKQKTVRITGFLRYEFTIKLICTVRGN